MLISPFTLCKNSMLSVKAILLNLQDIHVKAFASTEKVNSWHVKTSWKHLLASTLQKQPEDHML